MTILITLMGQSVVGKDRSNNEDAFVLADLDDDSPVQTMTSPISLTVKEHGVLIAVSDGMGGAVAGEVASKLSLDALRRGMSQAQASSAGAALRGSIDEANQEVFATARTTGRVGMGATLTAVLFHGVYAHVAEIGDSRAYLLRGNRLTQLTRDQSYVQDLLDKGLLTAEQAKSSEYKNVILQAMGLNPYITVPMRSVSLRRQDRFLLCSDGLSGVVEDQVMLDIILDASSLDSACSKLIEAALGRGSEDDITVILAAVDGEGVPLLDEAERVALETVAVLHPG
jgi:serine/threonine protein phosphatase PrpC